MAALLLALPVVAVHVLGLGLIVHWLLGADVGRVRIVLTGTVGFFVIVPATALVVGGTGVLDEERLARGDVTLGYLMVFLVAALWVFTLGAAFLAGLERVWPSHSGPGLLGGMRAVRDGSRRAVRYLHIVRVAVRHGLGPLLRGRTMGTEELGPSLVRALGEAGVTFVKIGQVLASRRDLVPGHLADQLATLQTQATAEDWCTVERVLTEELGRPPSDVFARLERTPLAAASIGQVHAGTLATGEDVVVKVQRPRARAQVLADIDIAVRLCRRLERRSPAARRVGLVRLMEGMAASLRAELDYRTEAGHLSLLRSAARHHRDGMLIPRPYPELSTVRTLVMDRMPGRPLASAADTISALDPDRRRNVATELVDGVLHQILVDGIFHADLHPGNIMIHDDGTLGLIDFGSVAILDREQRELLLAFFSALRAQDARSAAVAVRHLTGGEATAETAGGHDDAALRGDLGELFTIAAVEQDTTDLTGRLLRLFRRHQLAVPAAVAAAVRTLASLQEAIALLDHSAGFADLVLGRVLRAGAHLLDPETLPGAAAAQALTVLQYLRRLPDAVDAFTEAGASAVRDRSSRQREHRAWRLRVLSGIGGTLIGLGMATAGLVMLLIGGGTVLPPDVSTMALAGSALTAVGLLTGIRSGFALHRLVTGP